MKIIDRIKNLINKINKKDYMLEEGKRETVIASKASTTDKDWISRVDVSELKLKKTREDIIRELRDDIIVEDLSEEYNYDKFSEENIKAKYDTD